MDGNIAQQRNDIERLLADSPSLRDTVPGVIDRELVKARRVAELAVRGHNEPAATAIDSLSYAEDEVLSDWFSGEGVRAAAYRVGRGGVTV